MQLERERTEVETLMDEIKRLQQVSKEKKVRYSLLRTYLSLKEKLARLKSRSAEKRRSVTRQSSKKKAVDSPAPLPNAAIETPVTQRRAKPTGSNQIDFFHFDIDATHAPRKTPAAPTKEMPAPTSSRYSLTKMVFSETRSVSKTPSLAHQETTAITKNQSLPVYQTCHYFQVFNPRCLCDSFCRRWCLATRR